MQLTSRSAIAANAPLAWGERIVDRQFATMTTAYQRNGGLASDHDFARLLRKRMSQPLSVLARWIVLRYGVSFVRDHQAWLPMFQFDCSDMSLKEGTQCVVREFTPVFDDWEVAAWFARGNGHVLRTGGFNAPTLKPVRKSFRICAISTPPSFAVSTPIDFCRRQACCTRASGELPARSIERNPNLGNRFSQGVPSATTVGN